MHPRYPLLQDIPVKGARVFVRVDFNVPLKGGDVVDPKRIEAALPTVEWLRERGARIILASHLGRPDGRANPKFSMEPVGKCLTELLDQDIVLADDCIGDGARSLSQQLREGQILLLENLRFHAGEEKNAPEFVDQLAQLCDVYVSDAFGTLHRAHASTTGLAAQVSQRGIGLLVQRELEFLQPLRDNPPRPFMLVMGGAKVSDKIALVEHFLDKIDVLVIGGAMAYAFLKARGVAIGNSLCDEKQVALADRILGSIEARMVQLILPVDHIIAESITAGQTQTTHDHRIHAGMAAFDIGPKTLSLIERSLSDVETVFWNGPVGVFENPLFSRGTFALAKIIADSKAKKLAGGGDVAAAIGESGCESRFDFISTGGGATLEYLEGKRLPGLSVLEILTRGNS